MLIDQGDLLWGTDMLFINEFMWIATKEHYNKGDSILREGEETDYFYTLIEGMVRLTIGKANYEVYVVSRAGEVFGWSSLLERKDYSKSKVTFSSLPVKRKGIR